jgi:large subunit ribosomal protein L18
MSVFVSNKHMYVQFIDDDAERTLASVSTLAGSAKGATGLTAESAAELGKAAAEAAGKAGVKEAVFDRGGFKYGRRMKALADAAREAGLAM